MSIIFPRKVSVQIIDINIPFSIKNVQVSQGILS